MIDIGDLDYEWQLSDASEKLETFVRSFELYQIGLNNDLLADVCPEATMELYQCMESTTNANVQAFYNDCLEYISEIFQKGSEDLIEILGELKQQSIFCH